MSNGKDSRETSDCLKQTKRRDTARSGPGRCGALRAMLLACAAGIVFAFLLKWHYGEFRHDIVGAFQQNQSALVHNLAGSLESELSE